MPDDVTCPDCRGMVAGENGIPADFVCCWCNGTGRILATPSSVLAAEAIINPGRYGFTVGHLSEYLRREIVRALDAHAAAAVAAERERVLRLMTSG